jgi:hypothetical protein
MTIAPHSEAPSSARFTVIMDRSDSEVPGG